MTQLHYLEFIPRVEQLVRDVVRQCYPTSWDENHISYGIADTLAKMSPVKVSGLERPFKVIWDVRKLRGDAEQKLGDLAVIVRLTSTLPQWFSEDLYGGPSG